jgi:hypothetical protein
VTGLCEFELYLLQVIQRDICAPASSFVYLSVGMAAAGKNFDLVIFLEMLKEQTKLMEIKMIRYIHKQCNVSGWLSSSECQDSSKVGVMMKVAEDEFKRFPEELDPAMIKLMSCINAKVAFTMVSKTTATLFRHISPYQNEIVVQPHGIRIAIVESLDDIMYLASTKKLKGFSCLVRREEIFLVWSHAIENILPHGAESEKLLVQTVGSPSVAPSNSGLNILVVWRGRKHTSLYDATSRDTACNDSTRNVSRKSLTWSHTSKHNENASPYLQREISNQRLCNTGNFRIRQRPKHRRTRTRL